jgi:hypothetical protein
MKIVKKLPMAPVRPPVQPSRYNPEKDGVTFSLLTQFKDCRELARLSLNGWTALAPSMPLIFGGVSHKLFEVVYADMQRMGRTKPPEAKFVHDRLAVIEKLWKEENPRASAQSLQYLEMTQVVAEAIMPIYFKHWQSDFRDLRWLPKGLEREFKIPFTGVSGPGKSYPWTTFMRGKMDGLFFRGKTDTPWLFETKTKSRIEDAAIAEIMPFELQVGIYLWATWKLTGVIPGGVLYNILRRPGLRQKQNESLAQFGARMVQDIHDRPDWYFIRMEMKITKKDLERTEEELRDLVGDFLMWWAGEAGHYRNSAHCENKYGTCHMLPICSRRDTTGFYQRDRIFLELEGV